MPIRFKYTNDKGLVFKGEGVLTYDDLRRANGIIYANDEKIRSIAYQLVDLSAIDGLDLSNDELERIGQQDQRAFNVNPEMRIAVIGPKDLTFGLARVWEVFACELGAQRACEIFRDEAAARAWLQPPK